MSIEVKNILKQYGSQTAVNHISFTIQKGEIVGFLGPNGAGKSTTMKMITGYLEPTEGSATVCGIDVTTKPLAAKQKVGYLPESNALYHEMYVREYLGFVADVHTIVNKKIKIEEVIQQVGLTSEAHKKISQLSKGYKQRVGLAAALIHNPEVLILDEPTSGLDPNQIVEIRNVIKELGKQKTVLFSSHIMQEVQAICDRVIIINKGNVVADDQLSNLQTVSKQAAVQVSFKEAIEAEWLQRLPAAKAVVKIDAYTWELQSDDEDALRKQILSLAVEQNLNIVSLQSSSKSLEDVFRSLTS
jgi:ABC-2 type transport system ATP-binding protein